MRMLRGLAIAGLLVLGLPLVASARPAPAPAAPEYVIGPGDMLHVFVWKNPDLSMDVPVRPDGRITVPLVQDMQAEGRTPTELAASIREALAAYVTNPVVTVVVKAFAANDNSAAIRVIGTGVPPKSVPYRAGITALDVIIAVGGLDAFANGDRATLVRREGGMYHSYPLHLSRLLNSGDLSDNVRMQPGDIIRIPERLF